MFNYDREETDGFNNILSNNNQRNPPPPSHSFAPTPAVTKHLCQFCPKSFGYEGNFIKHLEIVHKFKPANGTSVNGNMSYLSR